MYVAVIENRSVIFVKICTENVVCSDRNNIYETPIYLKYAAKEAESRVNSNH